jgi:hypothetical protein
MMKGKKIILAAIFSFICCSFWAANESEVANANAKTINEMLTFALKYQQKPYQEGAEGPSEFDCPGFNRFVFKELGIDLPKTAALQAAAKGKKVTRKKDLKEGDLVFFGVGSDKKTIKYTGIVFKKKEGDAFDFLYVSKTEGVTIASDENELFEGAFISGNRVTSDLELSNIRKNHAQKQKDVERAKKEAEKKKMELDKANKEADKARSKAENAKKEAERANSKLEKARK